MSDDLIIKKKKGQIEIGGDLDGDKEVMIEISRDFADDAAFYVTKSEAIQIIDLLKKVFEL